MGIRVQRACDPCRLRKVKCNGKQPCPQCEHLHLSCIFSGNGGSTPRAAPKRKRILSKIRKQHEKIDQSCFCHRELGILSTPRHLAPKPGDGTEKAKSSWLNNEPSQQESLTAAADQTIPEGKETFLSLLPLYERYVYVMHPIITCAEVRESISQMDTNVQEHGAFVYAFAAVTINFVPLTSQCRDLPESQAHHNSSQESYYGGNLYVSSFCTETNRQTRMVDLVHSCLNARFHGHSNDGTSITDPLARSTVTLRKIMTCAFLAICLMALRRKERAFAFLREAITLMQLLPYNGDRHGLAQKHRLHWLLFIHERFAAVTLGLPPILASHPLDILPPDETLPSHVQAGFQRLCHLFSIMDDDFMRYWTASQGSTDKMGNTPWIEESEREGITAAWIEQKHQKLDEDERVQDQDESREDWSTDWPLATTELQSFDLRVTRLWMHTLLWQLAASRMLLNGTTLSTTHRAMSLIFPARHVIIQLRDYVSCLGSTDSVSIHGSGILDKLFEITNAIADVLLLVPRDILALSSQEDFAFLVKFLFSFDRIGVVQRNIIEDKVALLRDKFSHLEYLASFPSLEPALGFDI